MSSASLPKSSSLGNQLHKYITRNSEYLVEAGICIEVRARKSSERSENHAALDQAIVARVRWRRAGGHDVLVGEAPEVGDSLLLGETDGCVLTSAVRRIERPPVAAQRSAADSG